MRFYTNSIIDKRCRCYFGGGGGGGGGSSKAQNEMMVQQMQSQSAAAQANANAMAAQAAAQQKAMQDQLAIMEQQRKDALESQRAQLEQLKANQVKPDPATRIVDGGTDSEQDQRKQAAKRTGLRKSILAGESYQGSSVTGPQTLG